MLNRFLTAAALGTAMLAAPAYALVADAPTDNANAQDKSMAVPNDHFPAEWFWASTDANWEKINSIVGKKATDFQIGDWHNDPNNKQSSKIEDYAGKPMLIDFWGTWCGPCIAAAPKVSALAEKYAEKMHVFAVCNTRRGEVMAETAERAGMKIPTAVDIEDKTATAYGVQWWPYYVLVDSKGVVRAAGIRSDKVEDAMKKLIEIEAAQSTESVSIPATPLTRPTLALKDEWLEGDGERREMLNAMHSKPAPALVVENWMNSTELTMDDLKGKIVVLDFWATWCGPCIASIPKNNAIAEKFADQGVVFIGVCHPRGVEKMAETASEHGIKFPIAADTSGDTNKAYHVNGYPDYYIIDRQGNLFVADARNSSVEDILTEMVKQRPF